jgi:N-acetylmuramoyl-L-alanine amidase
VSKLRVHSFSISIDGYGAGPNQDLPESARGWQAQSVYDRRRAGHMRGPRLKMKSLLTICLLLISISAIASAQQKTVSSKQKAVGRIETGLPHSSLTRAQTREAERLLSDMGYWTGAVDGLFDAATGSALIAFQKWEGRPVTGQLTLDELEAIRTSTSPKARELGYGHVEVDLDRQVLLVVDDDGRVRVLPISSGSGKPFVDEGQTSIAHTPRGRFLVYDKVVGWEKGSFRSMYYSNYISGGVAIHGYRSVPIQAESHGCIRIPIFAAREVSRLLPIGTIVLVYDKVTFVSGKPWVESPQLKEAALDWNRVVDN